MNNMNNNMNNNKPHDVEIIIKYHDGTHKQVHVEWNIINLMKSLHQVSAIENAYNAAIDDEKKN